MGYVPHRLPVKPPPPPPSQSPRKDDHYAPRTNCKNCGAVLRNYECAYCGTSYRINTRSSDQNI